MVAKAEAKSPEWTERRYRHRLAELRYALVASPMSLVHSISSSPAARPDCSIIVNPRRRADYPPGCGPCCPHQDSENVVVLVSGASLGLELETFKHSQRPGLLPLGGHPS